MIRILFFVLPLLLLGAGGGAAWWFYFRAPDAAPTVEDRGPTAPLRLFVDFDPMVLPVIRNDKVVEHLTFTIIVEVATEDLQGQVKEATLRLKDAYRSELHALFSRRIIQERDNVVPLLNKRLKNASDRVLGEGVVNQVLVNIMTRRDLGKSKG